MSAPISPDRKAQATNLARRLGPGSGVTLDPQTGGLHQIFRSGGFLSQPQSGNVGTVVQQYLTANAGVFGLSPAEITAFITVAEDSDRGTGVTHLYLQEQVGGIAVFGTSIKAHVDAAGRVISVEGNYYPGIPQPNLAPRLSAQEAVLAAMSSSVPDLLKKVTPQPRSLQPPLPARPEALIPVGSPMQFPNVSQGESGADLLTVFDPGPFLDPIRAHLVIFPSPDAASLAWEVHLHAADRQANYTILIDASSGALLYRSNGYRTAVNSNAAVFTKNPDAAGLVTLPFYGNPVVSPNGWSDGQATIGNNVQAFSATSKGDFIFPFTDAWKTAGANPFDLAGKRVRFTPVDSAASQYSVAVTTAPTVQPSLDLSSAFSNRDDGSAQFRCFGFNANVTGTSFSQYFWVNTNGSIGFQGGNTSLFPTKYAFQLSGTTVAGLWTDLNVIFAGTLSGSCFPEGTGHSIYVAWNNVPQFYNSGSNTFSITVHGIGSGLDNVIDIDYNAISDSTGMLVGVGGGGKPGAYVDLTAAGGVSGLPGSGVAQTFPDSDLNLSTTNMAYHLNWMHDYFYQLGFTESAGNFQVSNFGRGGAQFDPVQAEAQYGLLYAPGGYNNAFFSTASDGIPGFTAFGLWGGGTSCQRDSALDASVIHHEATHGLTTRMVGGPLNAFVLESTQGGALGEGWSDSFSGSTLNDPVQGAYVTCNPTTGVRTVAYNASPLTYANFGNRWGPFTAGIGNVNIPEFHFDGEIWASTMWDLRTALGSTIADKLMFEGLRYAPIEPTMVDARNGILIADLVVYGGSHITSLYNSFAARGMGVSASSSGGEFDRSGNSSEVFAAFDNPTNPLGTAQLMLFSDDFEHGPRGWTTQGADGIGGGALWHVSSRRVSGGTHAYYYGQESTGNYDTGYRNYGSVISPAIQLPTVITNASLMLEWDEYKYTEGSFLYDGGWVRIIDVATGTRTQVSTVFPYSVGDYAFGWAHRRVNLDQFAGKKIQVEFFMDTFDSYGNFYEGWYLDNVNVSILGVPVNAGFESGTPAPWALYGPIAGGVSSTVAHSGGFSLTETSGSGGGFFQDVSGLVPGQVYVVSAWVSAAPGATAQPSLVVHDTTGANSNSVSLSSVGTIWQLLQVNFIATSTGKVRIHLQRLTESGALFWDDVSVAVGSPGIFNLGFESGNLSGWGVFSSVTASVTNTVSNSGTFSLSESGGNGGVYQDVGGLAPGHIYQITAQARSQAGTVGQAQLYVHDTTGANSAIDGPRSASSSFFSQFTVNFVATTTGAVRIHLIYTGGTGTVYWDDVSLVEGGTTPQLVNGGFEGGVASPWLAFGTVGIQSVTSSQAHTGSFSFQQGNASGGAGGIYQNATGLIPGQTYRIGVWVLGSSGSTTPAFLYVHDSNGANTVLTSTSFVPGTAWQYLEVSFTATTSARAMIHLIVNPGSGSAFFDDVLVRR